jgi:hypothetical protein
MNAVQFLPLFLFLPAGVVSAQQNNGPEQKPNVYLENNRPKNEKEANLRTIDGTVKDSADNPLASAIVQLKDTKTLKIVDFATKDDGKFVFRELAMDINYEVVAKRGDVITPVKKVSVYDTRKHVVLNFQLAAAKP